MKNRIIITSSVAGFLALLLFYGRHMAPFSHHLQATWYMFVSGFLLATVATILATTSLPGHWRSGGIIGRFLWSFAVLAGYAGLFAYGS